MIRAGRLILGIFLGIGAILAFITTFIAFGYALKIIAVLMAVIGVLTLIVFLVWAAIKEFVFDARKKPPK